MTIYRGYDIVPYVSANIHAGYTWTDERGFEHFFEPVTKSPYDTEEQVMCGIDAYKRNMARAK